MASKELLLATRNRGKIAELRALLGNLHIRLFTPEDLRLDLVVPEDGASYTENAAGKAVAFAAISGLVSLADDSGLEVDALGGAPGLHSARYVGRASATDADRRDRLLRNLRAAPRPWKARFRCAVMISQPGGEVDGAEGECPGEIIPHERGSNGFGYDPIFVVHGTGKTMAQLDLAEKNRVSHRASAIGHALPVLARMFGG